MRLFALRSTLGAVSPGLAFAGKDLESARRAAEQQQQDSKSGDGAAATTAGKDPSASTDQSRSGATDSGRGGDAAAASGSRDKAREGAAKSASGDDGKVPSTIAEWLQSLAKPAASPAADGGKASGAPTAPAASPPATAGGAPQASKGGRASQPVGLPLPPPPRPEILAVNMSPRNIERAVQQGFVRNGTAQVSRLGLGITRLVVPDGMTAEQAQQLLQQAFPDTALQLNQKYRIYRTATGTQGAARPPPPREAAPMATPCGTDRCFATAAIQWRPALQDCARAVRIGVIDTGYDPRHPAFHGRSIEARKASLGGKPKAPDWHGTGVLALLAGAAGSATPGLVPDAKYFVADIFYADADGQPASDTASLLEALDWLDRKNVHVVNLSLAGPPDDLLRQTIAGLSEKGIIFVAAVGNDGPTAPPSYPAAYGSVIAVTAVGRDLKSYRHASRGDHVDFAAPGVEIWTAMPDGQSGYHSGTSFAVPFVTAVLASVYAELPNKTKADFVERATAVDLGAQGRDPIYGRGLLLAPASCTGGVAVAATKPLLPAGRWQVMQTKAAAP